MSAFFQFFENVKKSNFFQSSKKNWTGATLMLCCCWLDAWVCEPLFSRRKFREIGSRFFYNSPFSSPSSCKTAWEGQQVLKIINVFDQEIGLLKRSIVVALCVWWLQILLRNVWSDQNVGKSGNIPLWEKVEIWLFALVWSQHDVLKNLCCIIELQKIPKQYFCDFHYIFFKAI